MKTGTKLTWGLILNFIGAILFFVGLCLLFTLIGACVGLPMMAVGFPLIIWGAVWFYKARAEKAGETIAKGIREGLSRFERPPAALPAASSDSISTPPSAPVSLPTQSQTPAEKVDPPLVGIPVSRKSAEPIIGPRLGRSIEPRDWLQRGLAAGAVFGEGVRDGIVIAVRSLSQRKPAALALALILMTCVAATLGVFLYQQSSKRLPEVATARDDGRRNGNQPSTPSTNRTSPTTVATRRPTPPAVKPDGIEQKAPEKEALKVDYRAEAATQAESFWRQAWLPFGDTWVARAKESPYLIQIRNRRVQTEPKALDEADRLNGVAWEGTVAFYHSAERRFGFESSAGGVRMDPYSVGWNEWRSPNAGAVAVYRLKKKNGRWSHLEHDLATAATMEWGRDDVVRPKTSELRLAGLNGEGISEIPATAPATSIAPTKTASSASVNPAVPSPPAATTKEPPGFPEPDGQNVDQARQSSANIAQWAGEQFPETRGRFLSPGEVQQWSFERLQYAINEMFARRGADFGDKRVAGWFQQFSWYRPIRALTFDEIEAAMPPIERDNLKLLGAMRDAKRSTATMPSASTRASTGQRVNPNFPPTPLGQTLGKFFQAMGDNARNSKAAPRKSPSPTNKQKR